MRRVWMAMACVLLLIVVLAPSATAARGIWGYTRWYRDGAPTLQGNLTWEGTSGGIVWGPADSEDNAPADTTPAALRTATGTVHSYAGQDLDGPPRTFTFKSAPLATDTVLNVTRPIQLELFLHDPDKTACQYTNSEPAMDVQLKVGETILGGTHVSTLSNFYVMYWLFGQSGTGVGPYSLCLLSMGPEMHILRKDSVLTLTITFREQQGPYSFGLKDEHQSNLRLPLLPDEEVLFRYPELAPPEVSDEDLLEEDGLEPSNGSAGGWLLLGLTPALGRRRGRTLLAVGLLTALALSGCVGKTTTTGPEASATLTGDVQNTLRRGTGEFASDEVGSIVGQIRDDMHIPIPDVHVSVLGSSEFTQSDNKGRFKLVGLLPGIYKLRFDKKEYRSFEADVEVKVGFVSRPEVTLFLIDARERDLRPHTHDYWPAGQNTKPIMDRALETVCAGAGGTLCRIPHSFEILPKGDDPNTILPGTSEVLVTLDWNPAELGQSRLGLAVQHNAEDYLYNYTVYAPRAPGVPFRIATSWEMADAGHQPVSTWRFTWFEADPYPAGYSEYLVDAFTGVTTKPPAGKVQVKVSVSKGGVIPLEPPHPDRWGTTTKVDTIKGANGYYSICLYPKPLMPENYCTYSDRVTWTASKVTPQGAGSVDVTLTLKRDTAPLYGWKLLYRPANAPPAGDPASLAFHKEAPPPTETGLTYKWKVPIKPEEADFIYARKSRWEFVVVPDDDVLSWVDNNLAMSYVNIARGSQQFTLSATVHKA